MAESDDIADVVVVGAGASGAAFTWSLAQAGINVVCLEQGGWVPTDAFPTSDYDAQVHLQTDFHPDPGIRGLPEDYPINADETPIAPLMYNAVGGSLIHWGAHFPRFHPSDFKVKTLEGVADDWPVTYEELEPYYDENDRMMGVSGLKGDPAYPEKPGGPALHCPSGPAAGSWPRPWTNWAGTGGPLTPPCRRFPTMAATRIWAISCVLSHRQT